MQHLTHGVNRDGNFPYIEDGTRIELAPWDYEDGEGAVKRTGTVKHHLGGDKVPVYVDGRNNIAIPHDYEIVLTSQIIRSWTPEEDIVSSETCDKYSGSCTGDEAVADVTIEHNDETNEMTLCPTCIAAAAWTMYNRNSNDYAVGESTVTITQLVGEESEDEVGEMVLREMGREFAYGHISPDDVVGTIVWQV